MKVKISLIPFILAAVAVIGLKLMSVFGLDGSGMFLGLNKIGITYATIGITIALFLVCVIINIFDRKTAPVYPVKKNPISAIFAILAGITVVASSVTTLLNTTNDSDYYLMTVICTAFSIPAAIALILMSKVHFTGKSTISGISMLFIFPALWGCCELVSEFLTATKVSISSSDMTALFCYIFITLYYFSHSMILSRIKGRNPVKACFIYGLPAVTISLAYGLYVVFTAVVEGTLATQILLGSSFIVFSIYALSFITEMAFNSYTKDEIEILDGMPEDDDTYENSYVKSGGYDELVFSEKLVDAKQQKVSEKDKAPEISGLDDFVIGYETEDDNEPIPYLTKKEMKNHSSSRLVFYDDNDDSDKITIKTEKNKDASVSSETSEPEILIKKPIASDKTENKPEVKTNSKKTNVESAAEAEPVKNQPPVKKQEFVKKPEPISKSESVKKTSVKPETKQPEQELSDIDLLLQELDRQKNSNK